MFNKKCICKIKLEQQQNYLLKRQIEQKNSSLSRTQTIAVCATYEIRNLMVCIKYNPNDNTSNVYITTTQIMVTKNHALLHDPLGFQFKADGLCHSTEHVIQSCLQEDLLYHVRKFSSCYMFTEHPFNRRECSFCYPPVSIAHAMLPSFEVCLLSYYRHIPSMTVS